MVSIRTTNQCEHQNNVLWVHECLRLRIPFERVETDPSLLNVYIVTEYPSVSKFHWMGFFFCFQRGDMNNISNSNDSNFSIPEKLCYEMDSLLMETLRFEDTTSLEYFDINIRNVTWSYVSLSHSQSCLDHLIGLWILYMAFGKDISHVHLEGTSSI